MTSIKQCSHDTWTRQEPIGWGGGGMQVVKVQCADCGFKANVIVWMPLTYTPVAPAEGRA